MAYDSSQGGPAPTTRYGEGLHLRALNCEKGSERYPIADDSLGPRISRWRCNLTALSRRRNLFFVACGHQIYVWEPAGGLQTLGPKPEMIITPVMKEPRGEGYIQPGFPHDINSILVDDLGREEVLLLVTDSGNVCGYRVEAIFSSLKRATEAGKTKPLDGADVDPFFLEYVDSSAWGIAIHKFARLIAVTANTGLVTVFAFALVGSVPGAGEDVVPQPDGDDEFTDYGHTWIHIKSSEQFSHLRQLMPDRHRTRNIKLTYTGHFSNIPSVTFLNCDLDPNGMWMVSTDIDNKVLVWKVWDSLGPFNIYYFNDDTFRTFPNTLRNDDRGWSVIALDPRTFHLLKSTEEACGGQPQRRVRDGQAVLDLTKLSSRVPDASRVYNYFPPAVKAEQEETVLPDIFGADCLISGSDTQAKSDSQAAPTPNIPNLRPSESADAFSHQAVNGSFHADSLSEDSASDSGVNTGSTQAPSHNEFIRALVEAHDDPGTPIPPGHGPLTTPEFLQFALLEALGGDVYEVEALLGENLAHDSDEEDPYFQDEGMEDADADDPSDSEELLETGTATYHVFDPPTPSSFPILHFSHTDIRLIPHPFASNPTVVCGGPLRQPFTHPIASIRGFDRFNMVQYIPEHGIVVAASQKGRAAVIALTESRTSGPTFRIDWIVPLESQEKYGERPLVPLLGMAVAPMQGFEVMPDVAWIQRDGQDAADDDANAQLRFQYRDSNMHVPNTPGASNTNTAHTMSPGLRSPRGPKPRSPDPHPQSRSYNHPHNRPQPRLTLPECHARATRAYQPEEPWRGWNPSRRYRLFLTFEDHTVMSYEFWYTWDSAFGSGGYAVGGRAQAGGHGASNGGAGGYGSSGGVGWTEDEFLIL
ncbi:hypothetical protein ASPCAL01281 [Aspergillus calidoustus]|uniref:Uncharacterized protein n=1 Tax=Aspergillus calidoustus TaxID=454130 RepID=A0A0U5FR75_ASPCI|nr:hypothetical protein ASPCAL01281 [Aspergillus calidoustus]